MICVQFLSWRAIRVSFRVDQKKSKKQNKAKQKQFVGDDKVGRRGGGGVGSWGGSGALSSVPQAFWLVPTVHQL